MVVCGGRPARRRRWTYSPSRQPKPKVPDRAKADVEAKAREIIETVLKPDHIKPHPEGEAYGYVGDIYTKWYRNFFLLFAVSLPRAECLGRAALHDSFEHVGPSRRGC